jgi:Uma2 family endonuclease
MTLPWPDRLLTLDDWAALPPEPSRRFELVEGVLVVAPRPALLHQLALGRLVTAVQDQLPDGLVAVGEVEVVVDSGGTAACSTAGQGTGPATVRVPDVIVVPAAVAEQNPARVAAADVLVAVEIVSPGTKAMDRVTKQVEYARAGIPGYWIVDLDPPAVTMTAQLLVDGVYEVTADGDGVLQLLTPIEVALDRRGLTDVRRG